MNNDKALKLEWVEAPNHISYGTGMMEAIIPLGKDSSLHLYCPVEQIDNVASALKALAQPEQEPATYSAWGLMGGDEFVNKDSLNRSIT